jgi:uncharacterized membrane protein
MSDELTLLSEGIPAWMALLFLAVALAAAAAVAFVLSGRGGERTLRVASAALCVMGLGVAGYVAIRVAGGDIVQCAGGGGGCETVEKSKYSKLLGIHVSTYGLIGYALILAASAWAGDRARVAAFGLSLFGFGFSLYLTYLELWEIVAICQWCVGSALLMTLLFAVNTTRMFGFYGLDPDPDDAAPIPPESAPPPDPAASPLR